MSIKIESDQSRTSKYRRCKQEHYSAKAIKAFRPNKSTQKSSVRAKKQLKREVQAKGKQARKQERCATKPKVQSNSAGENRKATAVIDQKNDQPG